MLDDRERRTLAEMEQQLSLQDPGLEARQRRRAWRRSWWPRLSVAAGLALAVGLLALGLVGQAFLIAALGAIPLALGRPRPARIPSDEPGYRHQPGR